MKVMISSLKSIWKMLYCELMLVKVEFVVILSAMLPVIMLMNLFKINSIILIFIVAMTITVLVTRVLFSVDEKDRIGLMKHFLPVDDSHIVIARALAPLILYVLVSIFGIMFSYAVGQEMSYKIYFLLLNLVLLFLGGFVPLSYLLPQRYLDLLAMAFGVMSYLLASNNLGDMSALDTLKDTATENTLSIEQIIEKIDWEIIFNINAITGLFFCLGIAVAIYIYKRKR